MTTDPHPWAATLDTLLAQAWARLVRGVGDRHAPARHPTLATLSPDGWPQARTVVLRGADPAAGWLEVHTDLRSAKVADLRATPRATLHVWDAGAHMQTRAEVTVTILSGAEAAPAWERVPDAARALYGGTPAPGCVMAEALGQAPAPDAAAFAVLHCQLQALDLLHLGPRHRRARFTRAGGWAGQWLAP